MHLYIFDFHGIQWMMGEKDRTKYPPDPTWGKGKSSSNMPYQGDMLIP